MKRMKKMLAGALCSCMAFGFIACGDKVGGESSGTYEGSENISSESGSSFQSESDSGFAPEAKPVDEIIFEEDEILLALGEEGKSKKVSAHYYRNGEIVEGTSVAIRSDNPDVVEVSEDCVLIPKGIGCTTVTATYGKLSATAEITVVAKIGAESVKTFDEAYVNTYGRTYVSAGKLILDYVATGLEIAMEGETLTVQIESSHSTYLNVFVDGEETERIALTPMQTEYTLAEGLSEGIHIVRLVKSSEVYDGQIRIVDFFAEQFYSAPEKPELYIEFVGDSITAGYGTRGESWESRSVINSDGCLSYAYRTAQVLNVDYSLVAIQGICVNTNMWLNVKMSEIYQYVSPNNSVDYEYAREPDVVVLNLGTNDATYIEQKDSLYGNEFSVDYMDFLIEVRDRHPDSYIVCIYGMMTTNNDIDAGIDNAIEWLEDDKILRFENFTSNTDGVNGYPTAAAQRTWGDSLAAFIEKNCIKA